MSQTPARIVSRNSARAIALQNSERTEKAARRVVQPLLGGLLYAPSIKKRGGAYVDRRVKGNFLLRAYNGFLENAELARCQYPLS